MLLVCRANLGEAGSASFMFEHKGVVRVSRQHLTTARYHIIPYNHGPVYVHGARVLSSGGGYSPGFFFAVQKKCSGK